MTLYVAMTSWAAFTWASNEWRPDSFCCCCWIITASVDVEMGQIDHRVAIKETVDGSLGFVSGLANGRVGFGFGVWVCVRARVCRFRGSVGGLYRVF